MSPEESLLQRIRELGGYEVVRVLDDGTIIALGKLMFTKALYVNLDLCGFEKRFCFADPALAQAAYDQMKTGDDEPTGWIARRPEPPGFYDLKK